MTTKSQIIELLRTNDRAVARALVVLNDLQTADERYNESTRYDNGCGFRPCHARMGTSMAKFYQKFGRLSEKQVAYWRVAQRDGKMRIEIYAGQLLRAAEIKAAKKQAAAPTIDVGNLMEEKMVLEEALSGYQEGAEQDAAMERIYDRLMQIREQVEEIQRCQYKMAQ